MKFPFLEVLYYLEVLLFIKGLEDLEKYGKKTSTNDIVLLELVETNILYVFLVKI